MIAANNFRCYDVTCPQNAVACKRVQTTNKDKSKLISEVECQDDNGKNKKRKLLFFEIS